MVMGNIAVRVRRCGTRKPGKAYFVVDVDPLAEHGITMQYFLQDPAEPVDATIMSSQGITVIPRVIGFDAETGKPLFATGKDGRVIHDVYDWVGGDYPNVVDFIEEVYEQGISRLNPRTSDFSNISFESEYRLVHPKAVIVDPVPFYKDRKNAVCPKGRQEHIAPTDEWLEYFANTCAGLWWECVTEYDKDEVGSRWVHRNRADGRQFGAYKPPVSEVETQAGIFMRFPIGKLGRWDVIKSDDDAHNEALQRLRDLKDGLFGRTRIVEC
jgi:hypothetical protein